MSLLTVSIFWFLSIVFTACFATFMTCILIAEKRDEERWDFNQQKEKKTK